MAIHSTKEKSNVCSVNTASGLTLSQKRYLHVKRTIDIVLSGGAIVILFPVLGAIALAIKLDSPGPVLFRQMRVGKNKKLFEIWKFRSMRVDTPKDMPTHMLNNSDAFITKTGKFLRKTSLDELPQIFNIFKGEMSVIGPRPALWNQKDLITERDKYHANDVTPGLTGWAQINGRDELEIPVKAKLDGDYVKNMSLAMDIKCFFATIWSVIRHDGVVEGGTGELHKERKNTGPLDSGIRKKVLDKKYGEESALNHGQGKRVLITGANSYIGTSVEKWLNKTPDVYSFETLDLLDDNWRNFDFSMYDVVLHVAGIAHADIGSVTEKQKQLYYKVNTELAVEVAKKVKAAGKKQFIFMSSMIIYSGCSDKVITAATAPKPLNFYGNSKWLADQRIQAMCDENFKAVILRPPMIYGEGSKGNFPELVKLASKLPVFPVVKNKRSMLYIDNLCQFIKLMIDNHESGVFFPQNSEYTNTSDMVKMIAAVKGHALVMLPFTDLFVKLLIRVPGRTGELAGKAFGDFAYDMNMSEYKEDYRVATLYESIRKIEEQEYRL